MITFTSRESATAFNAEPLYRLGEYSFDTSMRDATAVSSILINDIQLEMNEAGNLLFVSGYSPDTNWRYLPLRDPRYFPGSVDALVGEPIEAGVSYRLGKPGDWPVTMDRQSGWVAVGHTYPIMPGVEFARDTIIYLDRQSLVALWIRPKFID
jgi:hypothetical protein